MKILIILFILSSTSYAGTKNNSALVTDVNVFLKAAQVIRTQYRITELNSIENFGTVGSVELTRFVDSGENVEMTMIYNGPGMQCEDVLVINKDHSIKVISTECSN